MASAVGVAASIDCVARLPWNDGSTLPNPDYLPLADCSGFGEPVKVNTRQVNEKVVQRLSKLVNLCCPFYSAAIDL
eukprot:5738693-Amphidinium_carterae.1